MKRTCCWAVCAWAMMGLLAAGATRAEDGNGSIVGWGSQVVGVDLSADFVAVAAGDYHSLGLKSDGSIVAWGANGAGQCNVPAPNAGFVALAAGHYHTLGLKADGSIVAWGGNSDGQCDVPEPNAEFVALAAGYWHSLGLKADGSIVAWGENLSGQCDVPAPNADFMALAGGYYHSLGLKGVVEPNEPPAADAGGNTGIMETVRFDNAVFAFFFCGRVCGAVDRRADADDLLYDGHGHVDRPGDKQRDRDH